MRHLHDIASGTGLGGAGMATTMKRLRGSNRRGGFASMRAPLGTDAFNVEFVLQAAACLDWHALAPWMNAADARIGTPLPMAVYKLHVLASWFSLDGARLERACTLREDFRRFAGAPLHGPIVELRLYRECEQRLARARPALAKLLAAVDLQLVEHGFFPPTEVLSRLDSAPAGSEPPESTQLVARTPRAVESALPVAAVAQSADSAPRRRAALVWPWGEVTPVDRPVAVGRDAAYSDIARHVGADRKVSRRHAVIEPTALGVRVRDLGSSNGTHVDDMPMPYSGTRELSANAVLKFGTDLCARLVFEDEAG